MVLGRARKFFLHEARLIIRHMTDTVNKPEVAPRMFVATVARNDWLCSEHYRLVLTGVNIVGARAGQFLHLGVPSSSWSNGLAPSSGSHDVDVDRSAAPMLRRAFSIAGLRRLSDDACEMDVIYRVVGPATRWMESLGAGDSVSVMGPLGNEFPIIASKPRAWVVAGGVGLPPMLWLAEALNAADKQTVAFVGSRSADLLALTITEPDRLAADARSASAVASEFSENNVPVVISTDDGSLGFRGHAAGAMSAFFESGSVVPDDVVVYACGPEPMMKAVARFCADHSIECHVCMERAMACGTGTCQSCVVMVGNESAVDGWCYELCCTQGPVFDAKRVIWS